MTKPRGVFSELGRLRRVLVCRPGLAQRRLTPANCAELLFDDVLWVAQARNDHDAFTTAMTDRDVDVLELHDLLADIMTDPLARTWLLDRKLGPGFVDDETAASLRPWLETLTPAQLAEHLIGRRRPGRPAVRHTRLAGALRPSVRFSPAALAKYVVRARQQLLDR